MTEPDIKPLDALSDEQLLAMEQDATLPMDRWQAVEAERERRGARDPQPPHGGPPRPVHGADIAGVRGGPRETEDLRTEAALAQLQALLVPGETLLAYAVQRRLFAVTHRRLLVAATSGRFLSLSRGLLGGYAMFDVRWQDLQDATVRAGIFGATLVITSMCSDDFASGARAAGQHGSHVGFAGLRKAEAERVYAICQSQEQVWREKRRVRDLDELRAQSGGVQIGATSVGTGTLVPPAGDPLERLRRAKEMLDGGLISDTEYESIKARVVDGL